MQAGGSKPGASKAGKPPGVRCTMFLPLQAGPGARGRSVGANGSSSPTTTAWEVSDHLA
jgi:hypothetical protein